MGDRLIVRALRQPESYQRFGQTLMQQSLTQLGVTALLLLLIGLLIGHCTGLAWDLAQSVYRTWQVSRMQRRREQGLVG